MRASLTHRPVFLLLCGQLLLAALLGGAAGGLILHLRSVALEGGEHALRAASLLLADTTERALEAVDLVQDEIVNALRPEDIATPAAFRAHMASGAVYDDWALRTSALPQLAALTAVDTEGNIITVSRRWPAPAVNLADRDYFQAARQGWLLRGFVSRPVQNHITGEWTVYLGRAIHAPDGSFVGLITAALRRDYFRGLYALVTSGPDEAVSVFRHDGVLLTRYPLPAPTPANNPRPGDTFRLAGNPSFDAAVFSADGGVVRKISEIDGQPKMIATKSLKHYPVVLNVMDSMASILADWHRQALIIAAGCVAIQGLAVLLGIALLRVIMHQHHLNAAAAAVAAAEAREQDLERAAAEITHLAHHDALTDLPNRVLFRDRVTQAVALSRRGQLAALLYLDLDRFKIVNDTLGHPVGDALLRQVADRLRTEIRAVDFCARLGGDEFAIVQSDIADPAEASTLALRLIEVISLPYLVDSHEITIGASIGIAMIPGDGIDADGLMKNADLGLYRSKEDGRGRYSFFAAEMDAVMQERRLNELYLRAALRDGEFEMYYQPLMNIQARTVTGFEALVRWNHPRRGLLQPDEFVPFAEEIGLIVPLGKWALHQACRDAVTWPGATKVAVNVSVLQFADNGNLVRDVTEALARSGLPARRLELEITETVMLRDTDAILAVLEALRDLGVGIAMDDFGTGYSSLSYLRRFPFSKVKIDRSFVADLGKSNDCLAIIDAVTGLCAVLGMTTLAEGVETEEQLTQLRSGHCHEAQGYLFSQARPASEVAELCRRLNGLAAE